MNRYVSLIALVFFTLLCSTALFAQPVITSITPTSGPKAGGTVVTINGSGLTGTLVVTFDGVMATGVVNISDSQIQATSPAHVPGDAFIIVMTLTGNSTATPNGVFTYIGDWILYVGNGNSQSIDIFDASTDTFISTVVVTPPPSGSTISGMAMSPDGEFCYISDSTANAVLQYNILTSTQTNSFSVSPSTGSDQVAITPDGTSLYVVNFGSNDVNHLAIPSGTIVTASIPTGGTASNGTLAFNDIVINPAGTLAYISNFGSSNVTMINLTNDTNTGTPIPVGTAPYELTITPDGNFVYVSNSGSNTVSVISTTLNMVIATISDPSINTPLGIAATPDGLSVYVVNQGNNMVSHIDVATNTVIDAIDVSAVGTMPSAIAITPDSSLAYVSCDANFTMAVIDLTTDTVINTQTIGNGSLPRGMAITPDQSPVADFTVSPTTGSAGTAETFNGSASVTPTGTIALYTWNFGDGTTSTTFTPMTTHIYTSSGSYTATLTVTNSAGTSVTEFFK